MNLDSKNKFDETKPFDILRAEDFGGDLFEFYEPLENLIRKVSGVDIQGSRPVFLIGGRGTGKTMVLKFLSLEMQLKDFLKNTIPKNKSINMLNAKEFRQFIKLKKFIGIFLHFRTTEYDAIKGEISGLFRPYLSVKIAEQLLNFVSVMKSSGILSQQSEEKIIKYFFGQVKESYENIEYNLDFAFKKIKDVILPQFETLFEKSGYYTLAEIKKEFVIPIIIYKNLIFGLSEVIFAEIPELINKSLFIILDELEYLNEKQTNCIGQLIKDSDDTKVIFKMGARYMPKIVVGESSETLQESDDFRIIHITDALNAAHSGKKTEYGNLIKNILNKRLQKSGFFKSKNIIDIEMLFPNMKLKEEAINLVNGKEKHWEPFRKYLKSKMDSDEIIEDIINDLKFPLNPIIEKLNMLLYYRGRSSKDIKKQYKQFVESKNKAYSTLYLKNSLNLLFQLCRDYGQKKKYVGIDVYIHLSSGVIRNALELCNSALNTAYNYGYKPSKDNHVNFEYQDSGAKDYSESKFKDITRIKDNLGIDVQEFIKQIGTIFKRLHQDQYLVEPEPTHFETNYSRIKGKAKLVFDAALSYSYLQQKVAMEPKSKYEIKRDDFIINRILAPRFMISYRVRGRTIILHHQICKLIEGNDDEKEKLRKKIIIQNVRKIKEFNEIQKDITEFGDKNETD